jgi:dienelactone hydrolase
MKTAFAVASVCLLAAALSQGFVAKAYARDIRTMDDPIQVPIDDGTGHQRKMQGHICRPIGIDKPQLVILNHGSPPNASDRPDMKATSCNTQAVQWFIQQRYAVVLVLRLGYGETGGPWTEDYGSCENADYYKAGMETARQIDAMVNYAVTLPNVDPNDVIIVGQSAGGWGTIAYSSMPHPKVVALINMSGGRGGHHHDQPNNNCKSEQLVAAAGQFGKTAKTPMIWIYADNDTYFGPQLADAMVRAYDQSGGQAHLYRIDKFGSDGHGMFFGKNGFELWGPLVANYLTNTKPSSGQQ